MTLKDNLLGLMIIFIWGFNFVVIAWGVQDMPPLLMGAARFLCVALLGSLFVAKPGIPWRWMALYAITLCFGQFALLFSALAFGMPAGLASIVLQSQALFTILFSIVLLKEQLHRTQLIALTIAFFGLWAISSAGQSTDMTLIGFMLTIAGAMSWAIGNIVNRKITQLGYQANLGLVVWSAWIAVIPFALSSYYIEGPEVIPQTFESFNLSSALVLLYLAIGASILGYSMWGALLSRYPAGQVAPLTLGVPVVGIMCASFFLGETLNSGQILGILLVMLSLFINAFGKRLFNKKQLA
ncbi:EamA family transporter [Thalassotalea sp. PP2-459]|uniref:EamA family transporter n=1 Tax=Thalassotalea sp. PP2-459 TaxID=1742724 RepID=UPI0009439490|nr:EamA family transporter [Thalassotalea sp. PP2-459]OKY26350.1 O-acetylserine/cysteine exporter [Thalassotalea sp. PP2-459]